MRGDRTQAFANAIAPKLALRCFLGVDVEQLGVINTTYPFRE